MQIQFKKHSQIQNRDYILRVYPDNDNDFKPKKEHSRLVEIQKYDISTAEVYIFENKLDALGNRFLILEKLNGIPVQENVQDFTKEETKEFLAELARYLGTIHGKRSKNFEYSFPKEIFKQKISFPDYILMEANEYLKTFSELKLDQKYKVDTKYLYKWLMGHKPLLEIKEFSLIHGDVRPSNIIVNKTKITGLIDWEMSNLCDPAWDIGWSLFFFKLYDNLKTNRDFFFNEYWKCCEKYDIEARVYFYEFLAALKILTYTKSVEAYQKEKYDANKDFFTRVVRIFPKYISTVTHKD